MNDPEAASAVTGDGQGSEEVAGSRLSVLEHLEVRCWTVPGSTGAEVSAKELGLLFSAYDELENALHAQVKRCSSSAATWIERVRGGLATLLQAIAARPKLAVAVTRHFPSLSPTACRRYNRLLSSFVPILVNGRVIGEFEAELPKQVELLAIGAAESLIFAEVEAGNAERLPSLLPEILFSLLVPLVGPELAVAEMELARSSRA